MLITFGATFAGVFLSFSLWFASRYLIRQWRNKKALKAMMQEIQEELQLNIAILSQLQKSMYEIFDKGHIPMEISRLRLVAHKYAISSGEIRLLTNIRKQRLIRYSSAVLDGHNKFVENTERLLATFLLKDDGLIWAKYRVDRLVELADDTRKYLQDALIKLQQDKLPGEDEEDRMVKPSNSNPESVETRLGKIEKGINDIKKQLKDNEKTSTFHFGFVIGIALIAIATGIAAVWSGWATTGLDLPAVAFVITIGGVLIIVMSAWEYQGRYRKKLGISGLLTMFIGALLVVSSLLFDFAIMPLVKLSGLIFVVVGLYLMIFSTKLRRT